MIFGRLLGWYTMYTFLGLLPPDGILPRAKFTSRPSLAFLYIGSVTARHSSSWCKPNFAAYSAGRPSRWASVHILVTILLDRNTTDVNVTRKTILMQNWPHGIFAVMLHWSLALREDRQSVVITTNIWQYCTELQSIIGMHLIWLLQIWTELDLAGFWNWNPAAARFGKRNNL